MAVNRTIRTGLAGLLGLLTAAALVLPSAASVDDPDPAPEFYFTRLAYSEDGYRGYGRFLGRSYICPEFGGGNFFPIQGTGWSMDSPGADCKFMGGIHRLTGLAVHPNPNMIEVLDDELFKFPYAYIAEPGGMALTKQEAARLREYLLRGGFIHADDFWGRYELSNFEYQMKLVFPEYSFEALTPADSAFHTFFDIDEIIQIPGQGAGCSPGAPTYERSDDPEPRVLGMKDDKGRLLVVATYNSDLGDAWEYMDLPCYPAKYSGQAYRLGLNFMIYSATH
jgi:hypothetical protein